MGPRKGCNKWGIPPLNNSWVLDGCHDNISFLWRCFLTLSSLYLVTSLPGTHRVQEFLLTHGETENGIDILWSTADAGGKYLRHVLVWFGSFRKWTLKWIQVICFCQVKNSYTFYQWTGIVMVRPSADFRPFSADFWPIWDKYKSAKILVLYIRG